MDTLVRGAVVGITAAILGLVLKKTSPETALMLALASCAAILIGAFEKADEVLEYVREVSAAGNIPTELTGPVLKCTGIAVVSKVSADACRDAGASSAAGAVELVGVVSGIAVSIPLIRSVLNILGGVI